MASSFKWEKLAFLSDVELTNRKSFLTESMYYKVTQSPQKTTQRRGRLGQIKGFCPGDWGLYPVAGSFFFLFFSNYFIFGVIVWLGTTNTWLDLAGKTTQMLD